MATATYTIKQFGIVSVGKFFAIFGLVWGFLMGFVVAVSSMGSVMGTHALGFAGGLVAPCIMTIIGGVIGFIGGAVVAIIYNLVVEATGGVEMDLEVKGQV